MSFGYLGDTSTKIKQQVKNQGVISVAEAYELEKAGHLGGSLELIESQTVSSVSAVDFTSIKGDKFDVHLIQIDDMLFSDATGNEFLSCQLYESGTLETASVYQYAQQYGTSSEQRSTGTDNVVISIQAGNTSTNLTNAYIYYYNLNNSSKYSFSTFHVVQMASGGFGASYGFGGFVLPQASTVDGIRIKSGNTANITQANIKLYGVKQL
jgi:hypothetical protein